MTTNIPVICWASHSGDRGGAELALAELTEVALGHGLIERALVTVPNDTGGLAERLQSVTEVEILEIPYAKWLTTAPRPRWKGLRRHVKNQFLARRLTRELDRAKVDLVISNTWTFPTAALAARRSGVPHVWYCHETGDQHHFDLGKDRTDQLVIETADAVWASSDVLARTLRSRWGDVGIETLPPIVLGDGGPTSSSSSMPASRLGFIGPPREQKGINALIEALAELGPDFELMVKGGDTDEVARARSTARKVGVVDRVAFHRAAPLDSVYGGIDIVVSPSLAETFGRVTVEAVARGLRLVATDLPSRHEVLPEGSWWPVEPGNPSDLVRGIERAAAAPPPTKVHRKWLVERYGATATVQRLRSLLAPFTN